MTLLLTSQEAESVLTMEACLEVLEEAYRELAEGLAVNRPRSDTYASTSEKDVYYRYKTMEGAVPGLGVLAQRINSERIRWPIVEGKRRQDKFQRVYPNYYVGLVLLFSIETGELLAILKEAYLQKARVGGTSGLGIKYLARDDSSRVGIFGSGWQASAQLMAACAVRKISHIKVYSPNPENRKRFSVLMSEKLGVEVEPVGVPHEAATGVDILLAATNSMEPVLSSGWLEKGMHVGSINPLELDPKTLDRSNYIVVSTKNPGFSVHVGGPKEGIAPIQYKMYTLPTPNAKQIDSSYYVELGEVITGKKRRRSHDEEITLFLNNLGLAIQFAAVGSRIYQEARKKGIGKEIPSEWFLETVRPWSAGAER